jgi:N-acetylglucosamine kinase-like BadF-type ATPase
MVVSALKRIFIGIDGGGTKTTAALCNQHGEVLSLASGDSTNMQSRPWKEVANTLQELLRDLFSQANGTRNDVAAVVFGLAGADRPDAKRLIADAFGRLYPQLHIDNDAITALYSGTWGKPGIVLIAGTGSIAYGVSGKGNRYRVGGWGYLLGDEGSGFDLGKRAVTAVLRQFDGRGEETLLTGMVLQHFGVHVPADLISLLYGSANPRKRIAEAGKLLLQAAEQGDPLSLRLLDQAADELIELVLTCEKSMEERLPIVLAGGMLSAGRLQRLVAERLQAAGREAIISALPPVAGALIIALRHAGVSVTDAVRRNMTRTLL